MSYIIYSDCHRESDEKAFYHNRIDRRVDLDSGRNEEQIQAEILWRLHYALVKLLRDVGEEPELLSHNGEREENVDN